MVGQTIGKYRVVSRLGRGGMGTVYKAVDETLDREVAIKCLNADLSDADLLKRFRAEAIALARLNHPNIAMLFELTEHDGGLLMVMEFVRGETFDTVLSRAAGMPVDRVVDLSTQVLDALSHAHRAGIVHRDLKPANLMLADSGIVKVMDFGLARMAGSEHLTNDGYMVGTPAYMSPEQVLGTEIDGRADLYAMGVVLYRLLTGQLPFKADSGIAMVKKQMYDQPTPVRQLRTELPVAAEQILGRALAKAPADRYQTADEFKAALSSLITEKPAEPSRTLTSPSPMAPIRLLRPDEPTTLTEVGNLRPSSPGVTQSPLQPAAAPAPRRRIPVAALALLGFVLVSGIAAIAVWRNRTVPPDPAAPTPSAATEPAPVPATAPESAPASAPAPASQSAAPSASTPVATATPRPAARPPVDTAATRAPASEPPAGSVPATTAADAAAPAVVASLTFPRVKYLVTEEGRVRDRDASLRLESDALHLVDGETSVERVAYADVIGLYQSHSREPLWVTPGGASVPVTRIGGKFGFLKGAPDWVTVRTLKGFTPLRVQEKDLARMIAELETRTGAKTVRAR